jgi:hypothetical protein
MKRMENKKEYERKKNGVRKEREKDKREIVKN